MASDGHADAYAIHRGVLFWQQLQAGQGLDGFHGNVTYRPVTGIERAKL